jgi:hyperosmotically inducible protein
LRLALLANPKLAGAKPAVSVAGGVATLTGTVPSEDAKAVAEQTAKSIQGITSVVNQLEVVQVAIANVPDEQIETEATTVLARTFPDLDLTIDVSKGVITVRGAVNSRAQILQVAQTLGQVKGAKGVNTKLLTVEGGESGERIGSQSPPSKP